MPLGALLELLKNLLGCVSGVVRAGVGRGGPQRAALEGSLWFALTVGVRRGLKIT